MSKVKIIFDVTIIANVRNNVKSGIFSVARALLIEFMQKEEIELKLFCRENDRDLVWKNLKTYANAHNLLLITQPSTLCFSGQLTRNSFSVARVKAVYSQ